MANIGLDTTQTEQRRSSRKHRRNEGPDLDRVAQCCTCAMCLNKCQHSSINASIVQGSNEHTLLLLAVWSGQARGPPILTYRTTANHEPGLIA